MVIFIVNVHDLVAFNAEGQASVARDEEAPYAFPAAGELVGLPRWKGRERLRLLHVLQKVRMARSLSMASAGSPFEMSSKYRRWSALLLKLRIFTDLNVA
jgi:hypothetical protein